MSFEYDPVRGYVAKRPLKERISEAIAWGTPDRESTGLSSSDFTSLLSEALREISRLERALAAAEDDASRQRWPDRTGS